MPFVALVPLSGTITSVAFGMTPVSVPFVPLITVALSMLMITPLSAGTITSPAAASEPAAPASPPVAALPPVAASPPVPASPAVAASPPVPASPAAAPSAIV